MEEQIGKIIHFYDKIGVGVVRLEAGLKAGDLIHAKGAVADFEQTVESLQIEHKEVASGQKGEEVAIKLNEKVKEGDLIYKKT